MALGFRKIPENNKIRGNEENEDNDIQKLDKKERERLDIFMPEEPIYSFENLIVSNDTMTQINTALNKIKYHKKLYEDWNLKKIDPVGKRLSINLYGPPGTGKSLCADCIAKYFGKKIIKVNYADIESKYVGETPKNIIAAFKKAMLTDSVLFFDEADSILGKRLSSVTHSADHSVNLTRSVMLIQMDKFDGIVIFASNFAKNYDSAFVRRIIAHIEFQLPDKEARKLLWRLHLPKELPLDSNINIDWLSERSEGFSGADIKSSVILAACRAVEREERSFVTIEDFEEAFKSILEAKKNIGSRPGTESLPDRSIRVVEEKTYNKDQLPQEIKEELDKRELDHLDSKQDKQ